jgi:hypothetical protein
MRRAGTERNSKLLYRTATREINEPTISRSKECYSIEYLIRFYRGLFGDIEYIAE